MRNIVFTRIDDRLIHGQVMTGWVQYTNADEVVVVDDAVAKDDFMIEVMKASMPAKIKLTILSIRDATSYLQNDDNTEKIFLLVKTPIILYKLIKNGIPITKIDVGGMGAKSNRSKLYRNIAASDEERQVFNELLNSKIDVFIQVIPDTEKIDLKKLL